MELKMKPETAMKLLLGIIITVILFHLCILLKIIPYGMTWGGRLTNDAEMYVYEGLSISLNLVLGMALLIKGNYLKQIIPLKKNSACYFMGISYTICIEYRGQPFCENQFRKNAIISHTHFGPAAMDNSPS